MVEDGADEALGSTTDPIIADSLDGEASLVSLMKEAVGILRTEAGIGFIEVIPTRQSQVAGKPVLTQIHPFDPEDTEQGQTITTPSVTQHHVLEPLDTSQSQEAENPALDTVGTTVEPLDTSQQQTVGNPLLTLAFDIVASATDVEEGDTVTFSFAPTDNLDTVTIFMENLEAPGLETELVTLNVPPFTYDWVNTQEGSWRFRAVANGSMESQNTVDVTVTIPTTDIGDAIDLDGTQSITIASNASLQPDGTHLAFMGWVRLDTKSGNRTVFSKGWANGARQYLLWYEAATDRFKFDVSSDGSATSSVPAITYGSPPLDTWIHIAAWWNQTSDRLRIRINDTHEDFGGSAIGGIFQSGTAGFSFGRRTTGAGEQNWDGRLQHWGMSKGELFTSAEITEHYNGGAGRKLEDLSPGLQAKFDSYWKLGEASGNRVDSIGTNHLTEVNGPIASGPGVGQ